VTSAGRVTAERAPSSGLRRCRPHRHALRDAHVVGLVAGRARGAGGGMMAVGATAGSGKGASRDARGSRLGGHLRSWRARDRGPSGPAPAVALRVKSTSISGMSARPGGERARDVAVDRAGARALGRVVPTLHQAHGAGAPDGHPMRPTHSSSHHGLVALLLRLGHLARQGDGLAHGAGDAGASWRRDRGSRGQLARTPSPALSTRRTLIWVIRGAIPGILAATSIWVAPTDDTSSPGRRIRRGAP